MKKSIKTAIFACIFAAAFQITAFAGFTWRVESADSSYVGTTNVTVTNTSGKKETEDAPIVKRGTVVTFTEAAASATYTVRDGKSDPGFQRVSRNGKERRYSPVYTGLEREKVGRKVLLHRTGRCL